MIIKKMASRLIFFFLVVLTLSVSSVVVGKLNKKVVIKKPNILLVTVCSLRQDHLGYFGYQRNTSPNIDKLVETSTLFKNCYTHIPWTKPSVIALMTGKYPTSFINVENEIILSELLHSIGYITCGIIGTDTIRDAAKVNLGFDIFLDNRDLKTSEDPHTVKAGVITEKAIDFISLQQKEGTPIFLWLFFKDPHWNYLPPPPYNEKFLYDPLYEQQTQQLIINDDLNNSIGGIGEARLRGNNGKFITDKAYYISQYDAEISFMDIHFGKIIKYIKETGNFDDWIIILIADHGESLGEGQYFFDHGYTLSEATVKIPLIIKFPGQKKSKAIDELASICDIYPTIAELVGIDTQKMLGFNNYGKNLLDKNEWLKIFKRNNKMIILENSSGPEKGNTKLLGCISDSYKLIWNLTNNEKKLYDISGQEILLERYNKSQQKLKNKMVKFISSLFYEKDKMHFTNVEELKSLGYLQ